MVLIMEASKHASDGTRVVILREQNGNPVRVKDGPSIGFDKIPSLIAAGMETDNNDGGNVKASKCERHFF
jgi:hypothetical protein